MVCGHGYHARTRPCAGATPAQKNIALIGYGCQRDRQATWIGRIAESKAPVNPSWGAVHFSSPSIGLYSRGHGQDKVWRSGCVQQHRNDIAERAHDSEVTPMISIQVRYGKPESSISSRVVEVGTKSAVAISPENAHCISEEKNVSRVVGTDVAVCDRQILLSIPIEVSYRNRLRA